MRVGEDIKPSRQDEAQRYPANERRRVRTLLDRDREHEAREQMRKAAEMEVRKGVFVNLGDTVIEPTPEWTAKGDVERFTPKSPDKTTRSVSTVRRTQTPIVLRLYNAGHLTDEQTAACIWYRKTFALAGLDGHASSSQWNPNSTIRRSATDAGFGYVPGSEIVAEARDEFRAARASLPTGLVRFFEKVALEDLPLRRARRFARCRDDRTLHHYRQCAEALLTHCDRAGIVLMQTEELRHDD